MSCAETIFNLLSRSLKNTFIFFLVSIAIRGRLIEVNLDTDIDMSLVPLPYEFGNGYDPADAGKILGSG